MSVDPAPAPAAAVEAGAAVAPAGANSIGPSIATVKSPLSSSRSMRRTSVCAFSLRHVADSVLGSVVLPRLIRHKRSDAGVSIDTASALAAPDGALRPVPVMVIVPGLAGTAKKYERRLL